MFWILVHEASISIFSQRLRTLLAMLGILIGVSSVVVMVAIGDGSKAAVEEQVRKLGTNVLLITPGNRSYKGVMRNDQNSLSMEDVPVIAQQRDVVNVAPANNKIAFQVSSGKNNFTAFIVGSTPAIFPIRNWSFASGNGFDDDDLKQGKRVMVIGNTVQQKLFSGESAVGRVIRIKNLPFQVVGVLNAQGEGIDGQDQDNIIFVPITTMRAKIWEYGYFLNIVQVIFVQAVSQNALGYVTDEIRDALRQHHHLRESAGDNFEVKSLTSMVQTATETSRTLSLLIGGVASISLLVGGIGIMNIMLVTVAERTREIGIRKAVGATSMDVMAQFLLEAIMISGAGSFSGLLCGLIGGLVEERWFNMQVAFSLTPVLMALVVALVVGILSGIYPAYKAARMQPIEALRSVGG